MLRSGILNPQLNSLLARIRHTNLLVIADRGFPYWPTIETVDLALVDGMPTVLQVLSAIRSNFDICEIHMAIEFKEVNDPETRNAFFEAASGIPLVFEPHVDLKKRVPGAIGLVRTGDTVQFANMILESGLAANIPG
jgi:D-ribose pyranase